MSLRNEYRRIKSYKGDKKIDLSRGICYSNSCSMSLSFLQNIGLTNTENRLYELLLKLGEVPVSILIRQSKLKRPTVYKALATLEKKGLVFQRDIFKKIHARPESPMKLQELVEKENEKFQQARKSLNAILPGLASAYTHSTEKPVVKTYEGVDGLKKIYNDMLIDRQPIFALVQAAEVEKDLYIWLTTTFVRKRVRARIHVKAIVASSRESKEYLEKSKEEYRIARKVDAKKYPFEHEIDIYGDKVSIIHYTRNEPLIGIVIHHPHIARTMKAWFDLAWESTD